MKESLAKIATLREADGGTIVKGELARGGVGLEARAMKEHGGVSLIVATMEAAVIQPVIDALRQGGCEIRAVRPVRESLEDLFMRSVRDPVTGNVMTPGADMPTARTKGGVA